MSWMLFITLLVSVMSQSPLNERNEIIPKLDGLPVEIIPEHLGESTQYEDFFTVMNLTSAKLSREILYFPLVVLFNNDKERIHFALYEEQLSLFPYHIAGFCIDYQVPLSYCHMVRDAAVDKLVLFLNSLESQADRIKLEQQVNWDFSIIDRIFNNYSNNNLLSLLETQNDQNMKDYYKSNEIQCLSGWWNFKISNNNFLTYVIHHDVASYNESVGYFNGTLPEVIKHVKIKSTVFFEYIVYREIFPFLLANGDWKGLKYILVSTYRNWERVWPYMCYETIKKRLAWGEEYSYDVIPLLISKKSLLVSAVFGHSRDFKQAWDLLLNSLGYSMEIIKSLYHIKPFYRNAFIVKPIWLERLSLFMNKAINSALFNQTVRSALQVKKVLFCNLHLNNFTFVKQHL